MSTYRFYGTLRPGARLDLLDLSGPALRDRADRRRPSSEARMRKSRRTIQIIFSRSKEKATILNSNNP